MITMAGTFLVQGQPVALPDAVGAQLGLPRAPAIAITTPFAPPSLNQATLGGRHPGVDSACASLAARAQQYPGPDPLPAIRRALVMKCEQERSVAATSTGLPYDAPPEHGAVATGGLDTKTKIAIGAGALLVAIIVAKKLKKR